jgi:hypothetical protein
MTPFVDAYAVLGVASDASAADLKAAHRRLVRRHHPDVAAPGQREAATRRTQELNLAYGLVRHPDGRARYDRVRTAYLARAKAAGRVTAVSGRLAAQWDALVVSAGRWAGAWWPRHRGRLGRAGLRARMAGADAVGRAVWLLSIGLSALVAFLVVTAAQRLLGVEGPFGPLGAVIGGSWVGSRRGWERRLRLAGRRDLVPAARRAVRAALAVAVLAMAAGVGVDALLFA